MPDPIIIETDDGLVAIESSEYVEEGRAIIMDVREAFGVFYDERRHGPPRKMLVRDAGAFVARFRTLIGDNNRE